MQPTYEQAWRDLRRRRGLSHLLASVVAVAAAVHAGSSHRWTSSPLYYLYPLVLLLGAIWQFTFRCPRCRRYFVGRLTWRGPIRCKHCDLPEGTQPDGQ